MAFAPLGALRLVRLVAPALALAVALGGCKLPDAERPLPPSLDALPPRTARTAVLLTGAAEPGAKIVVTRVPALPKALAPVYADAATARFSVEVPLEPERANDFTVVAVDRQGQASPAATVTVVQSAAQPTSVALYLADSRPQLGLDGKTAVRARASLRLSEEGLPLAGYRVVFSLGNYPEQVAPVTAATDANGVATATLPGLGHAAGGTITATALDADPRSTAGMASDTAHFEVQPGQPTSLALELSAPGVESGTALTVAAGSDVAARATIKDAAGYQVEAPVTLGVVPDAFVAGGVLHFVKAGSYQVTARVDRPGSLGPLVATGSVNVTANTGGSQNKLQLLVSLPSDLVAGEPVPVGLLLVDPAGNQVTPASVTATLDVGMAFDAQARKLTSQKAGSASVTFKADRGDGVIVSALPVRVRTWPAAARTLELTLGGSPAPLSSPRATTPGQELLVGVTAKDAFGNAVPNPTVLLAADPDVELIGRTVLAPQAAGLYTVNGQVDGTAARALVAFNVQPTLPAAVTATCPTAVDAGASFTCSAVVQDAAGNVLASSAPGAAVTWTVDPLDGSDVQGNRITLRTAGVAQITAQLPGGGPRAQRSVTVRPGPATTLRLTLTPGSVAVGQTVQATTSVVDAYLNPVPVAVALSTDAPGALVAAGEISNLRQPGSFQIFARTSGASGVPLLSAQAPLTVTSAAATSVRLAVSPATTAAGVPVQVTASVLDAQGNPAQGTAQITVDGRPADQVRVQLGSDGQLVLLDAGTHVVTATLGDASDSRLVDVRPLPDTTAPTVTLLVEGGVRQGAVQLFKPGQTVQVTVRARDAGGLSGVRLRASSADLGVLLDETRPFAQPRTESEETFALALPADRVGPLTITATASDRAGNAAASDPQQPVSDFHFDRLQLSNSLPAGVAARSVSVDPQLHAPTGLAVGDAGKLYVVNLPQFGGAPVAGGSVQAVGRGGLLAQGGWDLGSLASAIQLSPLTGATGTFLFTGGRSEPDHSNVVQRLAPGANASQDYTAPPLSVADNFITTGVTVDQRTSTKVVYAGELNYAPPYLVRGRISSMPAKDQLSGFAADPSATNPRQVQTATFADHQVFGLCLPDGATQNELYFVGWRGSGATVGLYKLPLTNGQVPQGAATPVTIYEEARGALYYGACTAVTSGGATRLYFTRWVQDGLNGVGGKVQSVPVGCAGACQAQDVAVGVAGADLGTLWGLWRQGSSLYLAETQNRRLLRLDGLF